jgi:hypothetical protein
MQLQCSIADFNNGYHVFTMLLQCVPVFTVPAGTGTEAPKPPPRSALAARVRAMFVNHQRRTPATDPQQSAERKLALAHASLVQSEFTRIQQLSGRSFTWDACCNNDGSNALCASFSSPERSFLSQEVAGHHVWLHPPAALAEQFLEHMLHCWERKPHTTSACILLPASLAALAVSDSHRLRLLHRYTSGERTGRGSARL